MVRPKNIFMILCQKMPLPNPFKWCVEWIPDKNEVLVDTVMRYKGLESEIVFLWSLDGVITDTLDDLIYVGASRAKSILYLAGKEEICDIVDPQKKLPLQ